MNPLPCLAIAAYAVCMAGSNLCLQMASLHTSWKYWLWFAAGNIVGFLGVLLMPWILRHFQANLAFAVCLGSGFCLLQLTAHFLSPRPLPFMAWAGITLIASGIILLQLASPHLPR